MSKPSYEPMSLNPGEELSRKEVSLVQGMLRGTKDPVWLATNVLGYERLYPAQEEILRTFYRHKYDKSLRQMRNLYICAGQRSGKTMLGSMIMSIELFDVAVMPSPQTFFRLQRGQEIFLTAMATSGKLAEDGIFATMRNNLEDNDVMNQWFDLDFKNDRINYNKKHIHAQVLGSWINTAVGRTNKFVILDEIDYFEETTSKRGGWEIYSRMNKSRDTLGVYGHLMAISSAKSMTGPIMSLARQGIKEAEDLGILNTDTLGLIKPTWEMNPEPEFEYEPLKERYKHDLMTFYRDYACMPQISGGMQFPEGVKKFMNQGTVNLLRHFPKKPIDTYSRVLSMDPAARNDKFGLSVGRITSGRPVIDGVIGYKREDGDPFISPDLMWKVVESIVRNLNVCYAVFDTWMFPDLIEKLQDKYGIEAQKHITSKEDYDRFREYLVNGQMDVCYDDELGGEMEDLYVEETTVMGKPKVTHGYNKYKDLSDAAVNALWYLQAFEDTEDILPGYAGMIVI